MKQIICVGIYRSGTSLLSGTLERLGINVGRHGDLKDPVANPKGYYECLDAIELSEQLRRFAGNKAWHNVTIEDGLALADNEKANAAVAEYIKSRGEGQWGVKDPKMLPFFPVWEKHLVDPGFIFISRLKDSVITSWKKMESAQADLVPQAHENHLKAQNYIKERVIARGWPYIEIDYSEHVDDPRSSCRKIAEFINKPETEEAVQFCNTYSGGNK